MSMTMDVVVEHYGITLTITDGPHDTTDDEGWEHWAYTVQLAYVDNDNQVRRWSDIAWKQGTGITDDPDPATVLDSLRSDVQLGREDFKEFCASLGYDTDSRKAYASWEACKAHARELDAWACSQEMLDDIYDAEPM